MEQNYIDKMAQLGYDQLVCDIFVDWENVKDEILVSERKAGTGNGTVHVFLGSADSKLQKEFHSYYESVKSGQDPSEEAIEIKHFFMISNIVSMLGFVCNYLRENDRDIMSFVSETLDCINNCADDSGLLSTNSLFKLSVGSSKLRPYFKQFDSDGVFYKVIRKILLPNSSYKISLYKNEKGEYASFWLIGFEWQNTFDADSSNINLHDCNIFDRCICHEKIKYFILECVKYFDSFDGLDALIPYADDVSVNNPIKISKQDYFSLVGMFLETDIEEIKKRNEKGTRWFEHLFTLGEKNVFLSDQWYSDGNHQLILPDFIKLVKTCYGNNFYYKVGKDGEHELWIKRLAFPLQQIYYGAPGTGKSNDIKKKERFFDDVIRTTFHPDSDYSTFVGAYKPVMEEVEVKVVPVVLDNGTSFDQNKGTYKEKRISYKFVKQAFLKAYISAWNRLKKGENVLLVIEEINRGNCAQIFGDIFQLLDRETVGAKCGYSSYPISADDDLSEMLYKEFEKCDIGIENVKDGSKLLLPPNLYIWATMNTSDQSLFPIDSAFKRRWEWKYMPIKRAEKKPEKNWIIKTEHDGKTFWCYWWEFLEAINHRIENVTHSEDKQLGYFFAKPKNGNNFISTDTFVNKIIFYLWNDVFKDEDDPIFKYGNSIEDVQVLRSSNMYFRHFIEDKDKMIHYFINQLFSMGVSDNPVVPIDYLKNDKDDKVVEHLSKMRIASDDTPIPVK